MKRFAYIMRRVWSRKSRLATGTGAVPEMYNGSRDKKRENVELLRIGRDCEHRMNVHHLTEFPRCLNASVRRSLVFGGLSLPSFKVLLY